MRKAITIGYDSKGKANLLFGPEIPPKEHRLAQLKIAEGKFPKGIVRVERWTSDRGFECVEIARETKIETE